MNKGPVITVVMPCVDAQRYLRPAVEGILKQSFTDFELIIIDDGSTDGSYDTIRQLGDERVRYLRNTTSKGQYSCLNMGIREARGRYICLAGADEVAMPNRLAVQLSHMKLWKKVGCIGTGAQFVNKDGELFGAYSYASGYPHLQAQLLKDICFFNSSLMIRRSYLQKYGLQYPDEKRSSSEYEFMVKCAGLFPIRNIDEQLIKKIAGNPVPAAWKNDGEMVFADRLRIEQVMKFGIPMSEEKKKLHLKLMKGSWLSDEELDEGIKWLNELLDKNRKIRLYKTGSLHQVFEDILTRVIKKNQLGGWSIEKKLLLFLYDKLPPGSTVLELGSGQGTEALLKQYRVLSVEHDRALAYDHAENHTCLYAPIKDGWYDRNMVQEAIKAKPGLILVDGPPEELRKGILDHLDLFAGLDVPLIFDDIDRPVDRNTMISFCEKLSYSYQLISGDDKVFAFCTKR